MIGREFNEAWLGWVCFSWGVGGEYFAKIESYWPDQPAGCSCLIDTAICWPVCTVHCASKCIALYCIIFHCITPHYTVFYSITLYYIVFHSISLYYTVFHCIPLHFTVLKCIEFLFRALWYPMQCIEVQWPVYSALDQHQAKYHWKVTLMKHLLKRGIQKHGNKLVHWKVEMKEYWEIT